MQRISKREREIERERERERERREEKRRDTKQLYRFLPQSGGSPVPLVFPMRVH